MRPVQAENVILNKKKWDDLVSHPIFTPICPSPFGHNPWAYRRSCDDNKRRRYAIHSGHPHPKPDIASKPKTAEAANNSRNKAFSSASKTTFSWCAKVRSLAWLAFLWAANLASERNASLAVKKSIILAAGIC
jgi:hypothetical protein